MRKIFNAVLALTALMLTGCGSSGAFFGIQQQQFVNTNVADARFNIPPASLSDIPFPNDITRDPNTGVNALPGANAEPIASIDSLTGFSTAGTIAIPLDGVVDPNTVTPATVLVLNTTNNSQANVTVGLKSDGSGNSIITVTPTVPLPPNTEFIVVVTPGVRTLGSELPLVSSTTLTLTKGSTPLEVNGVSSVPGLSDQEATELEKIRLALQPVWAAAELATGENRSVIPVAFSFLTQSEFTTLQALQTSAQATPAVVDIPQATATLSGTPLPAPLTVPNPITTSTTPTVAQFLAGLAAPGTPPPSSHIGTIVFGSFQAPNFQNAPTGNNPTGFFDQPVGLPTQHGTNDITFIACLPLNQTTNVPAVIFQHGFTRTNFDVFAIADTLCASGQGVIAINLVLHGDRSIPGQESGTGFVNLASLRATRDNIRQSVSDQDQLVSLITSGITGFIPGQQAAVFSTNNPEYVGQSLGGIVGGIFLATNGDVNTGVLNVPGGRLTALLANSPTFGSILSGPDGLPAFGIQPGTPQFDQFLYLAQTVVDDADPFNYDAHLGLVPPSTNGTVGTRDLAGNSAIQVLMQEMVNDQVVPNSATTDLALSAGISQVSASTPIQVITSPPNTLDPITLLNVVIPNQGLIGSGLFQFQGGEHGFLLAPSQEDPNGILTFEGQEQAGAYLFTGQTQGEATIIVPAPPGPRQVSSPTVYIQHPESLIYTRH